MFYIYIIHFIFIKWVPTCMLHWEFISMIIYPTLPTCGFIIDHYPQFCILEGQSYHISRKSHIYQILTGLRSSCWVASIPITVAPSKREYKEDIIEKYCSPAHRHRGVPPLAVTAVVPEVLLDAGPGQEDEGARLVVKVGVSIVREAGMIWCRCVVDGGRVAWGDTPWEICCWANRRNW